MFLTRTFFIIANLKHSLKCGTKEREIECRDKQRSVPISLKNLENFIFKDLLLHLYRIPVMNDCFINSFLHIYSF